MNTKYDHKKNSFEKTDRIIDRLDFKLNLILFFLIVGSIALVLSNYLI
ncbi:MAG: hypothetical protein JKY08_03935 [Flavobacteriaceae bacterium]|nr:hypothetical protein [Flavobacteriaceae bacterium]